MNKEPLVIISGPTASGKTALSVELAKRIIGEIISADSMQVYKGMDIGSAKVSSDEMQGIKHYLIDVLDPKEDFNIFFFKEEASKAFERIRKSGRIPIICGGTGFYIQSFLYDIDLTVSEGENTAEFLQEIRSLVAIQRQDDLAVAAGLEFILPGIAATDVLMVIDLAVDGQHLLSVRSEKRLSARLRIHDAQPLVRQHGAPAAPDATPVRTPVPDLPAHLQGLAPQRLRLFPNIENTDYSTHGYSE